MIIMKKFLSLVFLSVCLMLSSGCSNKSLTCSKSIDKDVLKLDQEYRLKFNKDSVRSLSINIDAVSTDSSVDLSNTILQTVKDKFSSYYDEKGISYSVSEKSNGFNFKIKINFNKVSSSTKSKIDIINYSSSYETIKTDLEQDGFTCK